MEITVRKGRIPLKDRRLLAAALLLPLTVLLLFAALASGAASAGAAGAQPQVQDIAFETCVGASTEAALCAQDADGDVVLFQLTERPRLGTAEIEDDRIIYTPGARTGKDEFSYTAVDAEGNAAAPAKITVRIGKNRAGLTYSDMEGDPAHYAALCLAARGIMQGERIGDCAFFRPSQTVTRSEFIAMAASAAKLRIKPTDRTDFADDSGLSAWARPYISAAAADGLVCGYETAGALNEIRGQNPITLAEASVVMANLLSDAAGVSEVMAAEHDEAADWAQRAVSAMARAEILDESTASGSASAPLTRSNALPRDRTAVITAGSDGGPKAEAGQHRASSVRKIYSQTDPVRLRGIAVDFIGRLIYNRSVPVKNDRTSWERKDLFERETACRADRLCRGERAPQNAGACRAHARRAGAQSAL